MNHAKSPGARLSRRTLLGAGTTSLGLGLVGRADAAETLHIVYANSFPPVSLTDQLGILPLNFIPSSEFRLAIRKSFSSSEALLRQFDTAFKAALADGTLQAIRAKYV